VRKARQVTEARKVQSVLPAHREPSVPSVSRELQVLLGRPEWWDVLVTRAVQDAVVTSARRVIQVHRVSQGLAASEATLAVRDELDLWGLPGLKVTLERLVILDLKDNKDLAVNLVSHC